MIKTTRHLAGDTFRTVLTCDSGQTFRSVSASAYFVNNATQSVPSLTVGATGSTYIPVSFVLSSGFSDGDAIDLVLSVSTSAASYTLPVSDTIIIGDNNLSVGLIHATSDFIIDGEFNPDSITTNGITVTGAFIMDSFSADFFYVDGNQILADGSGGWFMNAVTLAPNQDVRNVAGGVGGSTQAATNAQVIQAVNTQTGGTMTSVGTVTSHVNGGIGGSTNGATNAQVVSAVNGQTSGTVTLSNAIGGGTVTLSATQSLYAPAKAGDAMALTSGERTTLAGVIWNTLTSALTTVGSIGKLLADKIDAVLSTIASSASTAATQATSAASTVQNATHGNAALLTAIQGVSGGGGGGNAPTVEEIDAQLSETHGSGPWGGSAGDGEIAVNHNTGGTDELRVMHNGDGIRGAVVRAYLKADYDAGERNTLGRATTGADGRWLTDIMLDAGTYVLTFDADGYELDNEEVTLAG